MKKNVWMAFSMAIVMAIILTLSGCGGSQQAVMTEPMIEEPEMDTGLLEGEVVTEEIQPIQPKEMQDINFDFDRFDLSPESRAALADNAAWIENNPGVTVQIEGHCDERGSSQYNLALGDRRAKSVYNYLINLGLSASRLSSISYGEEMPTCGEPTEGCWAKNRRAHFSVK